MGFQLLSELYVIEEDKALEQAYPLCESIETFLTALLKKAESRPEDFLKFMDVDQLSAQLNGLMILGKKEHRDVQDDFMDKEDVGGKQLSKNFHRFIQDVGEPHTDRVFKDGANANTLLLYIGKQNGKESFEKIKELVSAAKGSDGTPSNTESQQKLLTLIRALQEYYKKAADILTAAFMDKQPINPSLDSTLQPVFQGDEF
jgi:hypothetical protein